MKTDDRLSRLAEIAAMVRDTRSARLARIAGERDALKAQLKALDACHDGNGLSAAATARVTFAYESWASRRRAELNLRIAAKQAEWLSQLEEARHAFGRAQVLDRMTAAQARERNR